MMPWWGWSLITIGALLILCWLLAESRTERWAFTVLAVLSWVAVHTVAFGAGFLWAQGGTP